MVLSIWCAYVIGAVENPSCLGDLVGGDGAVLVAGLYCFRVYVFCVYMNVNFAHTGRTKSLTSPIMVLPASRGHHSQRCCNTAFSLATLTSKQL